MTTATDAGARAATGAITGKPRFSIIAAFQAGANPRPAATGCEDITSIPVSRSASLATVEFDDFARFALSWLDSACDPFNHYCGGADLDRLGDTDFGDLAGFAGLWLQDCPNDWLLK